jgi:tripartite-type tricarboxylate transporter receptor subunit TctC
MTFSECVFLVSAAIFAALSTLTVQAQDNYPSKMIRIVTAAPGSNNDWGARLVADDLGKKLGQRVLVENRGSLGVEHVAKDAPADGYTLLFYGSIAWLQPFLTKVRWDPVNDLAPITLSMRSPNVLVVHPSVPVKSTKELISQAWANPGKFNYGAGGAGASPHLAGELFKYMGNLKIVRVNYKGTGPAMVGLLSGEVDMMFPGLGSIAPHIKSGKVKALAVTTPERSPLAPDLPTVAEVLPGYQSVSVIGFFAPGKTPAAIINRLNREINATMRDTDAKRLTEAGVEAVMTTPEEFRDLIKSEIDRMQKVFKSAGFNN